MTRSEETSINKNIAEKIRFENIKISRAESQYYDIIHGEIFNRYEQARIERDIDFIARFTRGAPRFALDIGCGTGNLSLKFLKYGYQVVGVDISKEMIDILSEKIGSSTNLLELHCCDIDDFLREKMRAYDVVAISSVLHHLPNWHTTLETTCDRIKVKGILYITHEPTLKIRNHYNPINYLLHHFEYGVNALYVRIRLHGHKPPCLDYHYSDYHAEKGIDQNKLKDLLFCKGFKILHYEEYYFGKNMWFAVLNNWLRWPRTLFSLIAIRLNTKS